MSIDLRMPSINGTDREQLIQIRSYLYQLIPQLQWALNNVNSTGVSGDLAAQIAQISQRVGSTSVSGSGDASVSAEAMFAKLKPLIIKSADIVQAYYDEINKQLEGIYVAESDFGTFVQQTEQKISANSTSIMQNYDNVQTIISDELKTLNSAIDKVNKELEKLNVAVIEANAYLKSGLLYYDENAFPVYGLEIGQRNAVDGVEVFNKYARFTSNKLSFYDQNDSEVAYISDFKLYITNAEIAGSLKLGGFLIDTSKGLTIKWEGRG